MSEFIKKKKTKKLFEILIKLGFEKIISHDLIIFKLNYNDFIVLPKDNIRMHHLTSVRHHLYYFGLMNKKDFNKKLKIYE